MCCTIAKTQITAMYTVNPDKLNQYYYSDTESRKATLYVFMYLIVLNYFLWNIKNVKTIDFKSKSVYSSQLSLIPKSSVKHRTLAVSILQP